MATTFPGLGKFTDAERREIAAYLRSLAGTYERRAQDLTQPLPISSDVWQPSHEARQEALALTMLAESARAYAYRFGGNEE